MKTRETKSKALTKEEKIALISLVAERLENKVLFPRQVEEARKFLKHAKLEPNLFS
ncbi:hypothetical protein [Pinibacter aurantiacus]|uniref:Uncharacterized protein n=1 Tax=Pinibacter aurantiacus TaxID=2851599 RepID=A0A9E2SGI8_9BACT|nr:hypothetical protein [Pinibacter aurantiacus]MBV4360250.1 hypothetical protein [Pinibacter aurantiacus]